MGEPTIGGQAHAEFCDGVAEEAAHQVTAACALQGMAVPGEAKPYMRLAAIAAVAAMSRKLNEAGVRYTDQDRGVSGG